MRCWGFIIGAFLAATAPALAASRAVIFVDATAPPGGDGTARFAYTNLAQAVAAANVAPGPVTINVAPGDYVLTETVRIERSMMLHGSTELIVDDEGWPTGDAAPGTETRIIAANRVGSQALLIVGRDDAAVLNDVSVRGFVFQGATNGLEVLLTRVQNFEIMANIFRAPAFIGMQSVAASGRVTGNYFTGVGTGAALTGGFPASPSHVVFTGNRSVSNTFGGLLLNGASINIPELGDELNAVVRGNDLSDNVASASFSFGLRLFILRRDLGAPGDVQSSARIDALVQGNRIAGNLIGVSMDAGFPYRRVGNACDARMYSGEIHVTFAGNTVADSLLTPALVTFTRNVAALNPAQLSQWQYLHGASFVIGDHDGTLANAWIDHPASDPYLGPCSGDSTHESLGNVLIYNDRVVSEGRNF